MTVYKSPPKRREEVPPLPKKAEEVYRTPALPSIPFYTKRTEAFHLPKKAQGRVEVTLDDGIVLVGSDAHWWPEQRTHAERAFIQFAAMLQPDIIVANGDFFDGAGISRFSESTWVGRDKMPTVAGQLEATRENLRDIEFAAKGARRIWTLGNHDWRFERYLIERVPEFSGVIGTSLKDHFSAWEPAWSAEINNSVMILHSYRGGIHAPWNNVVYGGRTIVTGHLHRLQVRPFTDYNGTRWGVDCGMLADPRGPQFEYTRDTPLDWRSGFVVLTFRRGRLLWPELVWVRSDGVAEWRGEELRP